MSAGVGRLPQHLTFPCISVNRGEHAAAQSSVSAISKKCRPEGRHELKTNEGGR